MDASDCIVAHVMAKAGKWHWYQKRHWDGARGLRVRQRRVRERERERIEDGETEWRERGCKSQSERRQV